MDHPAARVSAWQPRRTRMDRATTFEPDSPPPDLWERLALLDRSCHVVIENITFRSNKRSERWSVTVSPRGRQATPLQLKGERLVQTLHRAVQEAERRDWNP